MVNIDLLFCVLKLVFILMLGWFVIIDCGVCLCHRFVIAGCFCCDVFVVFCYFVLLCCFVDIFAFVGYTAFAFDCVGFNLDIALLCSVRLDVFDS